MVSGSGYELPPLSEGLRLRGLCCRLVEAEDLPEVLALERASYPADEAASEAGLLQRATHARGFFLVVRARPSAEGSAAEGQSKELVGFVNGTLTHGETLEEESMARHVDDGTTLCVHSVCVVEGWRRQGVASAMLRHYVDMVESWRPQVQRILLIAKQHLLGFYTSCGFTLKKPSAVVHGADPWFEFARDLGTARGTPLFHVDAFTVQAFSGNPAAVVLLRGAGTSGSLTDDADGNEVGTDVPLDADSQQEGQEQEAEWMQRMAAEIKLPTTAFPRKLRANETTSEGTVVAHYSMRWFSVSAELTLCGHATLASAHVLFSTGREDPETTLLQFSTRFGATLCVRRDQASGRLEMNFPALGIEPVEFSSEEERASLLRGVLGSAWAGTAGAADDERIINVARGPLDFIVEVSAAAMDTLEPAPEHFVGLNTRGVIVTCAGKTACVEHWDAVRDAPTTAAHADLRTGNRWAGQFDIVSRYFSAVPSADPEDAVTGSAHCVLAPYWAPRLHTSSLHAFQASPRGGTLDVVLDSDADRVLLRGDAVTVFAGQLN